MLVDPHECLGSLLTFLPQLYDRWERDALANILRLGDVFVDIGSNIGAYSLWAARHVGASGRVIAVEPDEFNYRALCANIALNDAAGVIHPVRCGVSDARETLALYQNSRGNNGGHNFMGMGRRGPGIECIPLDEVLRDAAATQVRLLKIDIEGFESRVLCEYFRRTPEERRPAFLLVEIEGGPAPLQTKRELRALVLNNGYEVIREAENTLFKRAGVVDV
jgi:FkbM family methyltransferase